MDAARMAESRMPEMTAGKILRTIWMNTVEESLTSPRNRCPIHPAATENRMIRTFQEIPIFALFFRSLSLRTDMNRMIICGIPKYPSPQARPETTVCQSGKKFQ